MDKENKGELPVFLDITPDRIEKKKYYILIAEDFEKDIIPDILKLIYHNPECDFYLYLVYKCINNHLIVKNLSENGILTNKTENYYYKHPKFDRDFVKIREPFKWDWEREVVEKGPMFYRIILKLSKEKCKEIDRSLIIQELKESDTNPVIFNPSCYGVGFKGPQLWRWIKKKFRILI